MTTLSAKLFSGTLRRAAATIAIALLPAVAQLAEAQTGRAAAQPGAAVPYPGRQIALVTGSTDGLGREVALRLAASGAHVIIHGRNQERGAAVVAEIEKAGKGSAKFYAADLASLAQVRQFGETILREYDRLDVLVNNAGIWLNGGTRQVSSDGHELHFAVNYLAGFVLTRMLLPRIADDTPGRIVNVASVGQQRIQFDDVMLTRGYSDSRGYSQSKLAQILFSFDLAAELKDKKVFVAAVHPATMMATTMVLSRGAQPRATIDAGADAVMNAITNTALETGLYFNGMQPAQANAQAYEVASREQLRALSLQLTTVR